MGIASLVAEAIRLKTGCTIEEARSKTWLVDSRGLVTSARDASKLEHHKVPFAHAPPAGELVSTGDVLLNAVRIIKPTALIGVSAQGGAFTESVLAEMTRLNKHPLIFALSNPTSKSECTAEEAYRISNGTCVFASGSPFDEVTLSDGRRFVPGQGNNSYIFPGVGLAAVVARPNSITDDDFIVAAEALAAQVSFFYYFYFFSVVFLKYVVMRSGYCRRFEHWLRLSSVEEYPCSFVGYRCCSC